MDFLTPTLPFIAALQKIEWLLGPAKFLSFLGNEEFFLLLLPFVYWCVNRRVGARLGILLLASVLINHVLKMTFAAPRPYWLDPALMFSEETSYGFPSGHAQNAALIWTFLALQTRNRKVWVPLALLLALSITFSRLYLGVHFPADTFGGAFVGFTILGFAYWIEPRFSSLWRRATISSITAAALVVSALVIAGSLLLTATHQPSIEMSRFVAQANDQKSAYAFAGGFVGLFLGLAMARKLDFQVPALLSKRIVYFILGLVGLMVCWRGLALVLPEHLLLRFFRYGLTSWWVAYGALLLFARLERRQKQTVAT